MGEFKEEEEESGVDGPVLCDVLCYLLCLTKPCLLHRFIISLVAAESNSWDDNKEEEIVDVCSVLDNYQPPRSENTGSGLHHYYDPKDVTGYNGGEEFGCNNQSEACGTKRRDREGGLLEAPGPYEVSMNEHVCHGGEYPSI